MSAAQIERCPKFELWKDVNLQQMYCKFITENLYNSNVSENIMK